MESMHNLMEKALNRHKIHRGDVFELGLPIFVLELSRMGTLPKVPIPRAPWIQSPSHVTSMEQVLSDTQDACISHVARS